jgi:hypothetical protein
MQDYGRMGYSLAAVDVFTSCVGTCVSADTGTLFLN